MLRKLILEGVGPGRKLEADFARRLTLITGDNGLGKSFLLDAAWFSLTRTWPRPPAQATPRDDVRHAAIEASIDGKSGKNVTRRMEFDFSKYLWKQPQSRPTIPGLVIYAQVDGGFSVWDPARNYWKDGESERPNAFHFATGDVWSGLQVDRQWRCNGLYRDWASWQREESGAFGQLKAAIERLSPPGEHMQPGSLQRIHPDDSLDYPTIRMPYGIDVPLVHASAAVRRIMALAYLLVWAWREHLEAAKLRREHHAHRVIFLIDEAEAHLHPKWQRRILPALMEVVRELGNETMPPSLQIMAATHSPFVAVSLESFFDEEQDRLLDLDLDGNHNVTLAEVPFVRRGSAERWLYSPLFDMKSTFSETGEDLHDRAAALIEREMQRPQSLKKADYLALHKEMLESFADDDPDWIVWRRFGEKKGWLR